MDDQTLKILESIVYDFRNAVDQCKGRLMSVGLQAFPRGACGDISDMLGVYLMKKGYETVSYVSSQRGSIDDGDWSTHAWLEVDRVVVDITADQFGDAPQAVIVARESAWHSSFCIDSTQRRSPGSCPPEGEFKIALDEDYETIINQLYIIC